MEPEAEPQGCLAPEEGSELGVCSVPEDEGGRLRLNPLRLGAVSPHPRAGRGGWAAGDRVAGPPSPLSTCRGGQSPRPS